MNSADIKFMTDNQLIQRTEYLVRRERKIAECIIWHLQEIQERKLFLQMEYSSMFECLVKHSKFQTQFDHIQAHSKGGKATLENMQMLCRVHNNHKGPS